MLVLQLKENEIIRIGDNIILSYEFKNKPKIGIEAPIYIPITREPKIICPGCKQFTAIEISGIVGCNRCGHAWGP
jgi:hypothetical protein